ncbi:MAG: helix-turn-helix domain-containing protein, partial [Candidatus Udaeobacter sp.]
MKTTKLGWGRIRDAQSYLPASRSTYYNWLESGAVRSRRINGARYIDMDSLRQFIEGAPSKPSKAVSRQMTARAF